MPTGARTAWPQIGQFLGPPVVLNLSVASANVQLAQNTYYRIWTSVNAFIAFGSDGTVAASTSSHPLTAGLDVLHYTGLDQNFLAGVVAAGTGVLYASLISVNAN